MANIDGYKVDCFSIALKVANLIDEETGDSATIEKVLQITKQILDIGAIKN